MTVHMFRVFVGQGPMSVPDLDSRINDWVTSNGEWEDDSIHHHLRMIRTESGDFLCHMVDVRFVPDNSKANLLQKFEDKLKDKTGWYRVGYHECNSRSQDGPCPGWSDSVEWTAKDVSIPQEVPTFDGV